MLTAQPTPLEVPVTIQGATHVDGSDRRELFTETTRTTLTFENGAVVSLKAKVAPGQCLFLRNEQTGREILCRVLEYRQGSPAGYTDLEFTSRDPGFWEGPSKPTAIVQDRNNGAQASVPPTTENHVAAPKQELLVPIGDEAPVNLPPTAAAEPAAASSASTAATPQPADDADWNEAKDAELMAALARMAGDTKPKPSAAQGKQAKGPEAASEKASQPDEGSSDAAVQSNVLSILTSITGKIREFEPGKITVVAGIAASLLIAAMLGLSWHAKRNASINATPHSAASAQPSASTSQAPTAPAATSAAATTNPAPATSNTTNAPVTPALTTDKAQQPTVAQASSDPSAPSKDNFDGPVVVQQETKHSKPKDANTSVGETIPPKIIAQAPPAIPSWARGLDLDPVVQLDAVIDANGNLKATKALSGPRILQGAAKRAVALWIFEPALTDGKPTTTHMVLTVEFQR